MAKSSNMTFEELVNILAPSNRFFFKQCFICSITKKLSGGQWLPITTNKL